MSAPNVTGPKGIRRASILLVEAVNRLMRDAAVMANSPIVVEEREKVIFNK